MILLIGRIQKYGTNELIYNRNRVTDVENKPMVTKGEREGNKLGDWDDISTLLYIKQITNKNLLYSTGNSTQYSVMTYIRMESKKGVDIGMYMTDSLCCIAETSTTS